VAADQPGAGYPVHPEVPPGCPGSTLVIRRRRAGQGAGGAPGFPWGETPVDLSRHPVAAGTGLHLDRTGKEVDPRDVGQGLVELTQPAPRRRLVEPRQFACQTREVGGELGIVWSPVEEPPQGLLHFRGLARQFQQLRKPFFGANLLGQDGQGLPGGLRGRRERNAVAQVAHPKVLERRQSRTRPVLPVRPDRLAVSSSQAPGDESFIASGFTE